MLPLPENELDELADNFFCHLHDHCHSGLSHTAHSAHEDHHEEDLTNTLNPLRNPTKPRKSILANKTLLVLNTNHLHLASICMEDENKKIKCSSCKFNIGYRGKQNIRYFVILQVKKRKKKEKRFDF